MALRGAQRFCWNRPRKEAWVPAENGFRAVWLGTLCCLFVCLFFVGGGVRMGRREGKERIEGVKRRDEGELSGIKRKHLGAKRNHGSQVGTFKARKPLHEGCN